MCLEISLQYILYYASYRVLDPWRPEAVKINQLSLACDETNKCDQEQASKWDSIVRDCVYRPCVKFVLLFEAGHTE
jgi:hypothetical protein